VYDGAITPTAYAYRISLSGKAASKSKEIFDSLTGEISGYEKTEEDLGQKVTVFTKDKTEIRFWMNGSEIIVYTGIIQDEVYDSMD
jgi:hypothetical protein